MATIVVTLAITTYMVVSPAHWLKKLMQLTNISASFKVTLLVMGVVYLAMAWAAENYILQGLAKMVGYVKWSITKQEKKRKGYKVIRERSI